MSALVARSLPVRAMALHLTAAAVLVVAAWSALDAAPVLVLRGVAVLLAAAVALAADEPAAALLDAAPVPLHRRLAQRTALLAAVVLPAWALALLLARLAGGSVPTAALSLELAALSALGLAVPLSLRRWWRVAEPAVVAGPLLLGGLVAAAHLPAGLALLPGAPGDAAWEAAHGRWAVVLVAAAALLVVAAREPATARVSPGATAARRGRRATR